MLDPLVRLQTRAEILGSHNNKYLRTVARHKDALIDRLESRGERDSIHVWSKAPSYVEEMKTISEIGGSPEESLSFLACYYALQFLHLNLQALDVLLLDLSGPANKLDIDRAFMKRVGNEFRHLTACYMGALLDLFIPPDRRPEFVICGVGTRADQDDLDLGIVDDGSDRRKEFNLAIGKLSTQMMKHATTLHLYLSEHVGTESYSASIPEFDDLLNKEIHDFVIINEMLGANPIMGSGELFEEFRRNITQRYYFQPSGDNKYHEGYLRGILGETRSFILRQMKGASVNPKDDALRMIKGMIYAGKTIFCIQETNAWGILDRLAMMDKEWKETYHRLDESLTFLEIFRYLYQLLVVQEEEIFLEEASVRENLDDVARVMGYRNVGAIKARDHLLIHYHEYVHLAKETVEYLMPHYGEHLKCISIFSQLADWRTMGDYCGNLATDLIEMADFFRGTRYWDDILQSLEGNDGELLKALVEDLQALDGEIKDSVVGRYGEWGKHTFLAVFSIIVLLNRYRRKLPDDSVVEELTRAVFAAIEGTPEELRRLLKLFHHYPKLLNDFVSLLSAERLILFSELLEAELWEEEMLEMRDKLRYLCELHLTGSKYFKRFFQRVVMTYPEYILFLDDAYRLRDVGKGLFGEVDRLRSFKEKKARLGDYHDVEFLRIGLMTLQGTGFTTVNTEFTEFSDNYMQTLFDVCKREVDEERRERGATRDLLAIFAAGGHAREQAYDDDYDIMVVLDSDDEKMHQYSTRILTRMNAELIKRGTLPHYRFADHFGNYVTRMSELTDFLARDGEGLFVDKSQVLGARILVGSATFERKFMEKIISPHIFDKKEDYITAMLTEIRSRHVGEGEDQAATLDIKETHGGLRDIEMVLLIYKAKLEIHAPINQRLFQLLAETEKEQAPEFLQLGEACEFLKRLRDVYRLMVAAEDTIAPEMLDGVAGVLGFTCSAGRTAGESLLEAYHVQRRQSAQLVESLLDSAI